MKCDRDMKSGRVLKILLYVPNVSPPPGCQSVYRSSYNEPRIRSKKIWGDPFFFHLY